MFTNNQCRTWEEVWAYRFRVPFGLFIHRFIFVWVELFLQVQYLYNNYRIIQHYWQSGELQIMGLPQWLRYIYNYLGHQLGLRAESTVVSTPSHDPLLSCLLSMQEGERSLLCPPHKEVKTYKHDTVSLHLGSAGHRSPALQVCVSGKYATADKVPTLTYFAAILPPWLASRRCTMDIGAPSE